MDIDTLAKNKYVSLTTFRRDGTPVATPVWLARDGDRLVVVTEGASGKAKRLRNGGHVLVAPCDMRGRVRGDAVEATAQLQDAAGTSASLALIRRRYGLQARLAYWRQDRRAKKDPSTGHVGIAIAVGGSGSTSGV